MTSQSQYDTGLAIALVDFPVNNSQAADSSDTDSSKLAVKVPIF